MATITRLTKDWQDETRAFNQRSLASTDYAHMWVDRIHHKVRLEQDKVCPLVMIGVRTNGSKELIALDDGHRESTESWADLLHSRKRRDMLAPVLAVSNSALGFWAAVHTAFPNTREQRCWFHKIAHVLNMLSPSPHSPAQRPRSPRSGTPTTGPSDPRPPRRSSTTSTCCRPSTTILPSTGSTYAPRTRSSRPLPPSGSGSASLRVPTPGPPGSRWPTNSSSPPRPSSPTTTNQEVTLKPHDTLIRRS